MRTTDRIIILNTTRFSEKSMVLHCLSRSRGRCGLLVHNASRLTPFFQPLNILDCEIADNPKSSLSSAHDFSSAFPLMGIRGNISKNAISMFVAEVLFRSLREGSEDPGLYSWCEEEILLLDTLERDFADFHIRFLLDYSAALGFRPSYEDLLPFAEDSAQALASFLLPSKEQTAVRGSRRTAVCTSILKYLEAHLEAPLNIKSLSVLSELF